MAVFVLIIISIGYIEIKNITRINKELTNWNIQNFPWPNYPLLLENEDFIKEKKDLIIINKRLKTDKLIFNNNKNFLLMCGNIPFPCTPINKEACMGNITKIYGYFFVEKNNNGSNCLKLINRNVLY